MQPTKGIGLAVAFVIAAPALRAAPSPNDSFDNRIVLTGTNIASTGSNRSASKQNGEPDHAGNVGGASVWWSWTAPSNGDLTVTTDGSDFDTLLAVYTGSSVTGLSPVVSSDDHGLFVTGRVRFQAVNGTQYQVAVDGFNDGSSPSKGDVTLNLSFIPEPLVRPPNDNFANRVVLTGSSVTETGSNVMATHEPGEPLHAGKDGDTSVWWSWTAPSSGPVRISTEGSAFDTLLGVYIGTVLSNLTEVASSDDIDPANGILTSALTLDAVAGQTYQIAVDGYDGDAGRMVLTISSELSVLQLSDPVWMREGGFQFALTGRPGGTNQIEASVDLTNWASIGTVVNTNGTTTFVDTTTTNSVRRFYRAALR